MKSLKLILLSSALLLSFNGCNQKNSPFSSLSLPKLSVPALDLSNLKLDRSLPTVQGIKTRSSLSEVTIEWEPVRKPFVAGYRIFRKNREGKYTLIKIINDPYAAHYTDKNINQRVQNSYLISLYTKDGRVSVPTKFYIKPNVKPLKPVKFARINSGLPNRIQLLWKYSDDPRVSGYIIERYNPIIRKWEQIAKVDKRLSVEYIDRDVKPGITYKYRIIAITNDEVKSPPSNILTGSSKPLPPPVTGIMATTNLPRKVELIWKPSPIEDVDYYKVYASEFVDGLFTFIAKTRATHYVDKFDGDGEIRFYKVTVVDKDGLESTQQIKPVKGQTLGHLRRPIVISARIINNAVELKWQSNDPRTVSYIIYKEYWDKFRIKRKKIVNFKKTTFIDPKIKPDISYTYYIVAVDKYCIQSKKSRAINVKIEGLKKKKSWFF